MSPASAVSGIVDRKTAIRRTVLALRDAMTLEHMEAASTVISELWSRHIRIPEGVAVSAFLPIRSEVNVRPIAEALRGRGHRIALPVVTRPVLTFRLWHEEHPLVPAGFGTEAPGADAPALIPDVMIVPLAAFDRAGRRIGYGKGHYDTAIQHFTGLGRPPLLIGTAFACQEVDEVPTEDHDQRLDAILTESGLTDVTGRATSGLWKPGAPV